MYALPEQMIINNVEQIFRDLDKLMKSGDEVIFDISKVAKADTACLQLLCVMQKSLNELGHQITWQGNSEALKATARTVGVLEFLQL